MTKILTGGKTNVNTSFDRSSPWDLPKVVTLRDDEGQRVAGSQQRDKGKRKAEESENYVRAVPASKRKRRSSQEHMMHGGR